MSLKEWLVKNSPLALSPLHELHLAQGAQMEPRDGWLAPARFCSVETELDAAHTAVGAGELVGVGTLEVVGASLYALAERLGVAEVGVGAAGTVTLAEAGEPRWCRLTRTRAWVLLQPDVAVLARAALSSVDGCLHVTDVSSGHTTLAVMGPRAPDLLARLVRLDLDPRVFPDRAVTLTGAVGVPVQVLRWDRGPLVAYEVTVGRDVAEYFWEALIHAGQGLALQPIGVDALGRLHGDGESSDAKV